MTSTGVTLYTSKQIDDLAQTIATTIDTINRKHIEHGLTITVNDNDKIAIFGDIHGDIVSFKNGVKQAESLGAKYLIFCGDYIDKGEADLECIIYALTLFNSNPSKYVTLIGNHEMQLYGGLSYKLHQTVEQLSKHVDIVNQLATVIGMLPLCIMIEFKTSNRRVFCSHGAYPFTYKPKRTHIIDRNESVWKFLKRHQPSPPDASQTIYETNNTYNLNPSEYVNKCYADLTAAGVQLAADVSPYNFPLFSPVTTRLDELKTLIDKPNSTQRIEEIKSELEGKHALMFKTFTHKLNVYNAFVAQFESAKQLVTSIREHVCACDMYIVDDPEIKNVKSKEDFFKFLEKHDSELYNMTYLQCDGHYYQYPLSQLREWMNINNITTFIRGHQLTAKLCTIVDVNRDEHERNDITQIPFNNDAKTYVVLHSTRSYASRAPELFNCPKFAFIDGETIRINEIE